MYTRQKSGRQALANDQVEVMQGVGETSRDAHFFYIYISTYMNIYVSTHTYIYKYIHTYIRIPDGDLDAKPSPTIKSKGCRELVKRRAMLTFSIYIYISAYIYTYIPDGVLDTKISPTIKSKGCRELVKRRAMLTFSIYIYIYIYIHICTRRSSGG